MTLLHFVLQLSRDQKIQQRSIFLCSLQMQENTIQLPTVSVAAVCLLRSLNCEIDDLIGTRCS